MQDRIENVVGKYWIRVLGVNYRCSDIAFMGVSQLFEERKRVRKGYFGYRDQVGRGLILTCELLCWERQFISFFPGRSPRVEWWFAFGKHKLSEKDMQGRRARTCANRHVLDCLNPPKVVALTNGRLFWFHLRRWPPRKLTGWGVLYTDYSRLSLNGHLCKMDTWSWSLPFFAPSI